MDQVVTLPELILPKWFNIVQVVQEQL